MPCSSSLTKGDNPLCYSIEKDHGLSSLVSKGEPCIVDDIQLNKTILACFFQCPLYTLSVKRQFPCTFYR